MVPGLSLIRANALGGTFAETLDALLRDKYRRGLRARTRRRLWREDSTPAARGSDHPPVAAVPFQPGAQPRTRRVAPVVIRTLYCLP